MSSTMTKARIAIPKKIREPLLKEYSHKCAFCDASEPEVHHIDEDPTNNDPLNLLPLCPNHHHGGQHDRTRAFEPGILRLFRQYKDPTILGAEFRPLYQRLRFLEAIDASLSLVALAEVAEELLQFIGALDKADFYEPQVRKLIGPPPNGYIAIFMGPGPVAKERLERERQDYLGKLTANGQAAVALIVEMLPYQKWSPHPASGLSQ